MLMEANEKNSTKINELEKSLKEKERILNSNKELFSLLLLDYNLEAKGILYLCQKLSQTLLDFIVKVCEKYEINYWLDFGNMLGAVRHESFIPWDDDIDLGMMREDYNIFREKIEQELKEHELTDFIKLKIDKEISNSWFHSFIQLPIWSSKGNYLGAVDIFPYDYLVEYEENTKKRYLEEKYDFFERLKKGQNRKDVEQQYFEKVKLSFEKQPYVLPGVDALVGGKNARFKFVVFETKDVLPLKKCEYNHKKYNIPNNPDNILRKYYGNYMQLPDMIETHDRVKEGRNNPTIKMEYQERIKEIEEAIKNF